MLHKNGIDSPPFLNLIERNKTREYFSMMGHNRDRHDVWTKNFEAEFEKNETLLFFDSLFGN